MDKQQRGIQVIRIWLGVTMLIHGVMKVTSLEDTLAFFAIFSVASSLRRNIACINNWLCALISND